MLQLKQTEERVGDRGGVHDTYELAVNGIPVATINHFVEYTLDEVPVTFEPAMCNEVALFVEETSLEDELGFEEEDTDS